VQAEEGLDLADHFPARAIGVKHLKEKAKESAADVKDPLAAVGAGVGLGQEPWGQEPTQEQVQVQEALLAQVADALTHGAQAGAPSGEKRRIHDQYIYLSTPDLQAKLTP
jgi:NAD(P)H-hydrate repair Nnr-like enzyme with NAD(P)H-hydrate dehydratase domain